jgi:hypothetical protein
VPFAIWVWQNSDLQLGYTCQAFPAIWNGTCQVIALHPPANTNSKKVSSTEVGKFFGACHSPVLAMHSKVVRYKESNHSLNFFRETQPTHHTINFIVPVFLSIRMYFYWYPLLSCIVLVGCEMQFFALVHLDLPSMRHFRCSHFKQIFFGLNNWTHAVVWKPNHVFERCPERRKLSITS